MSIWLGMALLAQTAANPAVLNASTSPAALCADGTWRKLFTQEGTQCVAARNGVAFAPDERARFLARIIDEAAARYSVNFSPPPRPAAVVAGVNVTREQAEWLGERGYGNLPWPGGSDMTPAKEAGVVAHELAHAWFKEWFDSARASNGPSHVGYYSSQAPDWIDEIAATLNENSTLINERYSTWDRDKATLRPLADFLNAPHPNMTRAMPATSAALPPGAMLLPPGAVIRPDGMMVLPDGKVGRFYPAPKRGGAETVMSRGENALEDPEHKRAMAAFYLQTRAFADFLMETSGNPKIAMEIAGALRGGQTFEQWLGSEGARHRLPATVAALSTAWDAWVQKRRAPGTPARTS